MPVRLLLAATVASASVGLGTARAATTLVIAVPDDAIATAARQALAPVAATRGVALRFTSEGGANDGSLQRDAAAGSTPPDLLLMAAPDTAQACREGLLVPVDGRDDCAVIGPADALVLAWDEARDPAVPVWSDFWEVARFPGKRGLPRRARGTLEIACMADGIAIADVYKALGSESGVQRAFRKLDQLRPYVVWWDDRAEAMRVLQLGAVLMTAVPATTLSSSPSVRPAASFGVQWTGSLVDDLTWSVPKSAPHASAAASLLGQLATTASVTLPAGNLAAAPATTSTLQVDDAFWEAHPELEARFAEWLAR